MGAYLFTVLFYLLLFLLMCGTSLCGQVCATPGDDQQSDAGKTIELFKGKEINGAKGPDGETLTPKQPGAKTVEVKEYYSPFLVSTNKFLVALVGVNRTSATGKNITVLTRYVDIESETEWKDNVFKEPGKWNTQLASYDNCQSSTCVGTSVVRGFVAAAKGNKIYLLMVNASVQGDSGATSTVSAIEVRLAVGDFGTTSGGKITWSVKEKLDPLDQTFTEKINKQKISNDAFSGSALVKDGKVIFVLKAQIESKKTVFGFFNLEDTGKEENAKFLFSDEVAEGCYPYFFSWEKKIIRVDTQCTGGASNQMVKETTDFATMKDWKESSGSFHRFVGFFKDKNNFATAPIGQNNNVLLFTQHKKKDKSDVYLWMCDGNRSSKVGIITNIETGEESFYASFLYTKDKLFVLHQKYKLNDPGEENNKKVVFTLHEKEFNNITKTLTAWKGGNDKIETVCKNTKSTVTPCYTDGLVAFLSDKKNESSTEWIDEYFYESATVTQGTKVPDGFTFSREGAGAKWQVGKKQEGDQPYNFADPGFTLVATVTIDENNKETTDNSLLGLVISGSGSKRIGLWCNSEKKWVVTAENDIIVKNAAKQCEQGNAYSVALVLEGTKLLMYVDWEKIADLNDNIKIQNSDKIEHFYFGANAGRASGQPEKSYATITNVLLYNRPFTEEKEINELKVKQDEIDTRRKIENKKSRNENEKPRNNGRTEQTDAPPNTSTNENDTKDQQSSSPPPTTEDSAARVGVVGVLCFMLFGVFTLLGRYVY